MARLSQHQHNHVRAAISPSPDEPSGPLLPAQPFCWETGMGRDTNGGCSQVPVDQPSSHYRRCADTGGEDFRNLVCTTHKKTFSGFPMSLMGWPSIYLGHTKTVRRCHDQKITTGANLFNELKDAYHAVQYLNQYAALQH